MVASERLLHCEAQLEIVEDKLQFMEALDLSTIAQKEAGELKKVVAATMQVRDELQDEYKEHARWFLHPDMQGVDDLDLLQDAVSVREGR